MLNLVPRFSLLPVERPERPISLLSPCLSLPTGKREHWERGCLMLCICFVFAQKGLLQTSGPRLLWLHRSQEFYYALKWHELSRQAAADPR